MTQKDKEILDILKSFMSDDEISKAISDGNIKLGNETDIEKAESEKETEEEDKEKEITEEEKAPESSEKELDMEKGKKKPEEKIEKSEEVDIMKSMDARFEEVNSKLTEVSELKETISKMSDLIKSMAGDLEKIGSQPNIMKSVSNFNYLEKGGQKIDDSGKTILSASSNKEEIGEVLLKSIESEKDDIMKSQLEGDLMNYIGGGGILSAVSANYLYKEKGIRITQ